MNKNPWLEINIDDYINHMSSPEVKQYQLINDSFKTVLKDYCPGSIFVPGCTIGNGFEYIDWMKTELVTALDINPQYITQLRNRFQHQNKLELINEDFMNFEPPNKKYQLIFAALFFEYVNLTSALVKLKTMMHNSSVLFSMIQLPAMNMSKVSKTKYKSLEKLSSYINLYTEEMFEAELKNSGFKIISENKVTLENGKSFLLSESAIK